MSEILVCGSIALDVIGKYSGSFNEYEKRFGLSGLNVSLQLAGLDFSFGGCGMNVTWGLNQFGVQVIPVSVAGTNFETAYRAHLENNGITTEYIAVDEEYDHCALAVILSDDLGNQLTAFHAGASVSPLRILPSEIEGIESVELALLAPEDAPIMLRQARDLAKLGIPMMFDPGQGLAEFSQSEVNELVDLADHIIVNEHECSILMKLCGQTESQLIQRVSSIIITRGSLGSSILCSGQDEVRIAAVAPSIEVDPTGCGDAYRAGYLAGLLRGSEIETCGRMGALCATYNLESAQTQQYHFSAESFRSRYLQSFGVNLNLSED